MKKLLRIFCCLFCVTLLLSESASARFKPTVPLMSLAEVKPGMTGYAETVFYGTEIERFPVKVISVVPCKKPGATGARILIRAGGDKIPYCGIAAGMSGSPVYFDGRLAGALSIAYYSGVKTLGEVTPIDYMLDLTDNPTLKRPVFIRQKKKKTNLDRKFDELYRNVLDRKKKSAPVSLLQISGLSERAARALGEKMHAITVPGAGYDNHALSESTHSLRPGDSIGVLRAWGDVCIGGCGTVTAVDGHGGFIAYGHPEENSGSVAYPVSRAFVHSVVENFELPFKLATPGNIIGIIDQDRSAGIAGRLNVYPMANSVKIELKDRADGRNRVSRFQTITDEAFFIDALPHLIGGVLERQMDKVAGGTMRYTVEIRGQGIEDGWSFSDVVLSSDDVVSAAVEPLSNLISDLVDNSYHSLGPVGVRIKADYTPEIRELFVEKADLSSSEVTAGSDITVTVSFRMRRGGTSRRNFKLHVPDNYWGKCTLTVRAGEPGGDPSSDRISALGSPETFEAFLKELESAERACEVVVSLSDVTSAGEYQPTAKLRSSKMKDGTMRIFRSDCVAGGCVHVPLMVIPKDVQGK